MRCWGQRPLAKGPLHVLSLGFSNFFGSLKNLSQRVEKVFRHAEEVLQNCNTSAILPCRQSQSRHFGSKRAKNGKYCNKFLRNLHAKPWFRMRRVAKCEFCNAPFFTLRYGGAEWAPFYISMLRTVASGCFTPARNCCIYPSVHFSE